jgi:hypothetical protein
MPRLRKLLNVPLYCLDHCLTHSADLRLDP